MRATVLIDNISKDELTPEWGLSIYIEYNERRILLDTGASDRYAYNSRKLGLHISQVDYAVLSHAHYDHSNGIDKFFERTDNAKLYIRDGAAENCYGKKFIFSHYIGIRKGTLEKYHNRIVYAKGDYEIEPGVTLVPHKTPGLAAIGKKNNMYIKRDRKWYPDDFSHEQSLVFDTDKGLVVFNSCSHGGADNIIKEVQATYPDKKIYALIGGFHIFAMPADEVRAFAKRIEATGIEKVYTGHCTGNKSFKVMKEVLGDKVTQLYVGLTMEF